MPPKTNACRRCGTCCLPGLALIHEEDLIRWRAEKRTDILELVDHYEMIWAGDHLVNADGHVIHGCPFLKFDDSGTSCSIYETRPAVCRRFAPGSSAICPSYHAE